jgi:phosphatidylethanolamine-binding protein (PEBP) family uncharacterized protein
MRQFVPASPRGRGGPGGPRRVARAGPVAGALVAGLILAACGTSGRTLRPPKPGATAPTALATTTTAAPAFNNSGSNADLFVLSSSAFSPGGTIPAAYTCDGAGTSPPLTWSNVPAGTAGIQPTVTGIAAGSTPPGAVVLANGSGTHAYTPMCPPAGQRHSYEFTLYSLKAPSGLTAASDTSQAIAQVGTEATGTAAVLTGDYQRP